MGELIPLTEWAEREGIDSSTARHKAIKGLLRTAHKIGRNWVIDDEEVNVDNRRLKANVYRAEDYEDENEEYYDEAEMVESIYDYVDSCLRNDYLDHEQNIKTYIYESFEALTYAKISKEKVRETYFEALEDHIRQAEEYDS